MMMGKALLSHITVNKQCFWIMYTYVLHDRTSTCICGLLSKQCSCKKRFLEVFLHPVEMKKSGLISFSAASELGDNLITDF